MCAINLSWGFRKCQNKVYMTRIKTNTLARWENQSLVEFLLSLNFKKHFQDFVLILSIVLY